MERIFKTIQDTIRTEVPEIQWIDIDEQQFEAFGNDAPVDYPCVLVDFPAGNFSNMLELAQLNDITVSVRIAFKVMEKFNDKVPTVNRTEAFAHFAILKKVMNALHGLETEVFTPLIRTAYYKDQASIIPKIYTILFSTSLNDLEVSRDYETTPKPEPEILTQLNND